MNWEECQRVFDWDGSWRDIYVLGTDARDWQRLVEFLRAGYYPLQYLQAGEDAPMPDQVGQIFEQKEVISPMLSVNVSGIILNCHFFWEDEIEFDIDPREVSDEKKAESLFGFMAQVGRLLGKDVILTPENTPEIVLVRFDSEANAIKNEYVEWR